MNTEPRFRVFVSGSGSSVEEWRRALNAPLSELPNLSPEQKEVARKFKITEEDYARSCLALQYGQQRLQGRSVKLGQVVEEVLAGLGPEYVLVAVTSEMADGRWVLRIQTPQKVLSVEVARELGDDVLDSDRLIEREQLKNLLLSALGRGELITRR